MKKKYFSVIFLAFVFIACLMTNNQSVKVMKNIFQSGAKEEEKKQIVIVIDPGHGGRDPGKVGINGAYEKDINLSVSLKLKSLLELNDIKVVMTREEDVGLYSDNNPNKKAADLQKRVDIIQSNNADIAVSIHQNSFTASSAKGAQVFYHSKSVEGKKLAETLQDQLKETMKDNNHRLAKSNESYYMLKKSNCPLVIVECGYMSNQTEATLLLDDDYQEKLAWSIHLGIMKYINGK